MLITSVLHDFSLRSDSVGRLSAVMASEFDLSSKMIRISGCIIYLFCLFFVRVVCVLQYRSDD